jgi:GT2 family glycosyltransferase
MVMGGNTPGRESGLTGSSPAARLRVSIVCYASAESQLRKTVETLLCASQLCLQQGCLGAVDVFLVDNGPTVAERKKLESLMDAVVKPTSVRLLYCGSGKNIGFGAGHNLTFDSTKSEFHLVLNPDVELAPESLGAALAFMSAHHDCGIVVPAVVNQAGEPEYLCKRYPCVLDLLLRGFAPAWVRSIFKQRLADYEMRDVVTDTVVWQPPLISGCFMLLRSAVLVHLKGFSPQYFLYFEDYDFSLRASEVTRVAYVPTVRVVHYGGYAARKGWRHIVLFIRSAVVFFNHHGWKWC